MICVCAGGWHMYSEICILPDILSGMLSDTLRGILPGILCDILFGFSEAVCNGELAVEVRRRCPLRWKDGRWSGNAHCDRQLGGKRRRKTSARIWQVVEKTHVFLTKSCCE